MQYILSICLFILLSTLAQANPHYKHVPLKEFTSLDLYLVPDLGTRLIFPFVLDQKSHDPPFYFKLTNGSRFKTSYEAGRMEGQNIMVINMVPDLENISGKLLSDLFVSVDGYNISIRLHETNRLSKHMQNIVFTLTDDERQVLIQKQVAAKVKQALEEVKLSKKHLEAEVELKALAGVGVVAMHKPKRSNIKEKITGTLDTGEALALYLDSFRNYKDRYYMLDMQIDNTTNKEVSVLNITLFSVADRVLAPVNGQLYCEGDPVIKKGRQQSCLFITKEPLLVKSKKLKITLETNSGNLEYTW